MSSPKKNVAYNFAVALVDSATGDFKANPTLASGDFQISKDDGAYANLASLPTVTPAASINVKISLAQAEMNADKITVKCIDAAGDEWDDLLIFIDATVTNVDDIGHSTSYAGPRGPGVYLNDAAANTNTVDGVDGIRSNPVSTIAAAKTIADSLSVDRIYLVNDSSVTLTAAMEDYEFIGIGEMSANTVNFGSQDVDNSVFYNLVLTGAQGGTNRCQAECCVLSSITGMEITALRCLIAAGTLTLRNDCAFDSCFSAVAGADTPALSINSVADVNVYWRHYSGGLKVTNAVATTVMSYESDGQIIIDATCTSLAVAVRGNCSITDNGTTTDLRQDAAINRTNLSQDTAQVVNSWTGPVYFLDIAGNDSNDGLTPSTPWLTPKTKIEAGSAGDLFILGAGEFDLGTDIIDVPNNVSVHAAGVDITIFRSGANMLTASQGAIICPGNNSHLADFTIYGDLTDGTYQVPLGSVAGAASQKAFTNVLVERVKAKADTDAVYCDHASECSATFVDCIFDSMWDVFVLLGNTSSRFYAVDCIHDVHGPTNVPSGNRGARGAYIKDGEMYLYGSRMTVRDGLNYTHGAEAIESDATLFMSGCIIAVQSSTGTVYSISTESAGTSGNVVVAGCIYDRGILDCGVNDAQLRDVDLSDRASLFESKVIAATASTVVLSTNSPTTANYFQGGVVRIVSGTGRGQSRVITSHSAPYTLNVAPNWTTNPDSTSIVQIIPGSVSADLTSIHGTALTETSSQLAGRFVNFFDQSSAAFSIATALSSFKASGFATSGALATHDGKLNTVDGIVDAILVDTAVIGAAGVGLTAVGLASSEDVYHAEVYVTIDATNSRDEYTVVWFKNGVVVTSSITSPTIQVIKRTDGTDLVASTPMTQIGSTGQYKYDEATNRLTAGEAAVAAVGATIDASGRTWRQVVGRDSS